jgi:ribonuclease J
MSKNLKIFALGGLHEVGKNCYVLEKNDDIIIVDCGVKFLNNSNLADGTIPNFSYLLENRKKIKGLFITHGHEDHIGGIPFLLEATGYSNFPLYGSAFSLALLKEKLEDKKGLVKPEIFSPFSDNTVIDTAEFRVSFFRVTHSIPNSFGLIIEVLRDNGREVKQLLNYMKKNNIEAILRKEESLIISYAGSYRKILISELRGIDVKSHFQKINKNFITKQELDA